MKIRDITEWSGRWSTHLGTMDAHPTVADSVLVGLSLLGRSIINLVVECADGRYFGSISGAGFRRTTTYFTFLTRNCGRKLCEVMDAEIVSDCNSVVP